MATVEQRVKDIQSSWERERRGEVFVEEGLFGMRDIDGTVIHRAEFAFVGKCRDNILFIRQDGTYCKKSPGCIENGYMPEELRPYVKEGKAGFKVDGKVVIAPEYEYIQSTFGDNTVFTVVKDGREYYINDKGEEVLTRVRRFDGESSGRSPFRLRTHEFKYFTVMEYVGREDEGNPNVVRIGGEWIELERYSKEEVLRMLIDPEDDLAITEKDTALLCDKFSYEYSFYLAQASGNKPLAECMDQLEKMGAFCNSWHFVIKIWQAPGEYVSVDELRQFEARLLRKQVLGSPLYAVGHSDSIRPGEVRVLLVTFYHERCWPGKFEFEWTDKCRTLPITKLQKCVPGLRKTVEEEALPQYVESVFHDQIVNCVTDLKYYKRLGWGATRKALEYFLEKGSAIERSLYEYVVNARNAIGRGHSRKAEFFLKASLWAVEKGAEVNYTFSIFSTRTALDYVKEIQEKHLDSKVESLVKALEDSLLSRGAKTFGEMRAERLANTDYFTELGYLRK